MTFASYPWDIVEMPRRVDAFGCVTSGSIGTEIPFHVRHLYWMHDLALLSPGEGYATFKANEVFIPIVGGFEVKMSDGITTRTLAVESQPMRGKHMGLWCKPGSWREIRTPDSGAVMLVLSDMRPEDADHISDWPHFLRGVSRGK